MEWAQGMSEQEIAQIWSWWDRAMHDLVKYLEMMPRSLDWENLEDDDLEILYEAVFETRSGRGGARSAVEVFEATLSDLTEAQQARLPVIGEVQALLADLTAQSADLLDQSLEDVDIARLEETLFAVGKRLRQMKEDHVGTRSHS